MQIKKFLMVIEKLSNEVWMAIKKLFKTILTVIIILIKKVWIGIVKLFGWNLVLPKKGTRTEMERCVFVAAPHTSSLDFFVGAAYLWSCCSNGRMFIKKEYFHGLLGWILGKFGGISVDRGNKNNNMVEAMVREFNKGEPFSLAITPEATRKRRDRWTRGFIRIADEANVPIVPTYIDFSKKEIGAFDAISLADYRDEKGKLSKEKEEEVVRRVRSLYHASMAKHPENFAEL